MRYLTREIGGWVLVVLGLFIFYRVFVLLSRQPAPAFLESGPLMIIGIFVFRGGIHLLKVAVAAHVCQETTPEPGRDRSAIAKGPATRRTNPPWIVRPG